MEFNHIIKYRLLVANGNKKKTAAATATAQEYNVTEATLAGFIASQNLCKFFLKPQIHYKLVGQLSPGVEVCSCNSSVLVQVTHRREAEE